MIRLLGPNGQPLRSTRPGPVAVRARYDAASVSAESQNHWANADTLSAAAANSPEVRQKLRSRARYERDNNSYCSGIVETVANDTIGTGPRLQVLTDDPEFNGHLAEQFEAWTVAVGLAEKLRTFRESRAVDGEAFIRLIANDRLRTPVQLDLLLIEADQVASPWSAMAEPMSVDGIRFDRAGNPIEYDILPYHPGDTAWYGAGEAERVPAVDILHWFKARRPGQKRGVPELTPALPLFALLRRYTLATLSAAEIAAMFAALLKTTAPADEDTETVTPFDTQAIERGMMTALPEGYDVAQLKPEQPTTTYPQFKAEILREIARCLSVPYIVAAGDASGANYSSGRLDYQVYDRQIGVDQYFLETAVLDRIFAAWLAEARIVDPIVGIHLDRGEMPPHQWFWDGRAYIDPSNEADAATTRLENLTTTLADEWAARGHDWRAKLRQRAEEVALVRELGLTPEQAAPAADPATEPAMPTAKAPIKIRAAALPSALSLTGDVRFDVEAKGADGQPKLPTFTIVGYTGAPMNLAGFYSPVIVDLVGLKASRDRIPILMDHDPSRIIGHAGATIDASGVHLAGEITGEDADAQKVITHARNKFPWQASIGATIVRQEFVKAGEKAIVNGREVAGPILIAREARLHETSFVAIGADSQTSANVAASNPTGSLERDAAMNFEQWLSANGFDPAALSDTQRTFLRAQFDAAQKPAQAPAPAPAPTPTEAQATKGLDQIVAERRAEDARIAGITEVSARWIADRPTQLDEIEAIARKAIEAKGTTPDQFELTLIRALRASAVTQASGGGFGVHARAGGRPGAKMIEAALCISGGLDKLEKHFDQQTLNAAADHYPNGIGLQEVLLMAARENGQNLHSARDVRALLRAAFPGEIRAGGFSTMSLSGIFGNVANKFLRAAFDSVEQTWRLISAKRSVTDFKAITSYTLTGGMIYEEVGPTGELKHAELGEQSYTNQAKTYGRMFAITRTAIINDDLGALNEIPRKLGRGAALKLNDVFWTAFMNNASFFTSGNGNYFEGAATNLQLSSLTTAETYFMNQTDPDGYPLSVTPRILLVPNALAVTAANLMNSTMVANDTTANTVTLSNNPHAGKFTVVSSSYLSNSNYTGYSTTAWYLLADPADLPVIEVAFLNGRETPIVESADADFETLGVQFRGYHDFGVATQEYRAGVKSKGAA